MFFKNWKNYSSKTICFFFKMQNILFLGSPWWTSALQRENLARFKTCSSLIFLFFVRVFGFPGSGSKDLVKSVSRSTKLPHMLSNHAKFAMDLSHISLLVILLVRAQLPRSIYSHPFHTLQSPCSLKLLHTMVLAYVSSYKSKPPVHAVL